METTTTPPTPTTPPTAPPCSVVSKIETIEFANRVQGICFSVEPVNQTSCSGSCPGMQTPTLELNEDSILIHGEQECTCCQGTGSFISVKFACQLIEVPEFAYIDVKMQYFTTCSCLECTGSGRAAPTTTTSTTPEPTTTTPEPTTTTTTTTPEPITTTTTTTPEPTTTTTTLAPTTTPFKCHNKIDLTFIVDGSTSICGTKKCRYWTATIAFIQSILDSLTIGPDDVRVGIIVFANYSISTAYLNTYDNKDDLSNAVNNIPYIQGETNTTGAFREALNGYTEEHGNRADVRDVIIAITDGVPNIAAKTLNATVIEVHNRPIDVIAIGVGSAINVKVLKLISSPPGEKDKNYFTCSSYDTLDIIRDQLTRQACQSGGVATTTTKPRNEITSSFEYIYFDP